LLAKAYVKQGDVAAARAVHERAIAQAPADLRAYIALAALEATDSPKQVAALQRGLKAVSGDPTLTIFLGSIHERQGRSDAAIAVYETAVAKNPADTMMTNNLVALLLDRGKDKASLARALELGWLAAPWLQSAWTLADGDRELAARQFEQFASGFRDLDPATATAVERYVAAIRDPGRGPELVAAAKASPGTFAGTAWSSWLTLLGMSDDAMAIAAERGRLDYDTLRMVWAPTARGVLANPKFLELAKPSGLIDYWEAKGYPEGCRVVAAPAPHLDCSERWR